MIHYCHGTTSTTLYHASTLPEPARNALVPYGLLKKIKVLPLCGEGNQGSVDEIGMNNFYTSWYPIQSSRYSVEYAKLYGFSAEQIEKQFNEILEGHQDYIQKKKDYLPFTYSKEASKWNAVRLKVQQYRSWNESEFQQKWKKPLQAWIQAELDRYDQKRPGFADLIPCYRKHIESLQTVIEGISVYELDETVREKVHGFPILYLTHLERPDFYFPATPLLPLEEYGFENPMRLGEEICALATPPKHVDEVTQFLKEQKLDQKVKVISFPHLALEGLQDVWKSQQGFFHRVSILQTIQACAKHCFWKIQDLFKTPAYLRK